MPARSQRARLLSLLEAFDGHAPDPRVRRSALVSAVADALREGSDDRVWLALAVLRAELPTSDEVVTTRRSLQLNAPERVVRRLLRTARRRGPLGVLGVCPVRVVTDVVMVDVHHTARTGLATGIQRVVRNTIDEWVKDHELVLVGWSSTYLGLRELSPLERENALHGTHPHAAKPRTGEVTIPWKSVYVLPELAIESARTERVSSLARFSGNRTGVIGFDCVPLTTAETTGPGMGAAFSRNLAAVSHMDTVVAISEAAATEYRGWRRMLSGAGLVGPEIVARLLPESGTTATEAEKTYARERLKLSKSLVLLCVGSHEPRKNHLAVLFAAETLWQRGRDFQLVFVGGNSWGSAEFQATLERLQEEGRNVSVVSSVTDGLLWSLYSIATASVFPSLNEGYGLPVAESLSVGTPVVTSRFGSTAEIGAGGGVLLVDPRNDDEILGAIDSIMFDASVNVALRAEAATRIPTTWSDYAAALWDYFVAPEPVLAETGISGRRDHES